MIVEHVPPERPFIWFHQVVDDFGNLIELRPIFFTPATLMRCAWSQAVHHVTLETL